jgi:hypothetical protein
MILQQELHGEDFQKRTEFRNFIQRQNSRILFSDEATFRSDSIVNRHNMHYWSIDNPHWVRHVDHQVRWSINVWGGIIGEHVLGPHFFEGHLNGQMYLKFLRNECTDLIDQLPLNVVRNMIFQHDGTCTFSQSSGKLFKPGISGKLDRSRKRPFDPVATSFA